MIFGLILMIRKQKGAVLCHIKYMGCPPIELINHPAYQPFLIWQIQPWGRNDEILLECYVQLIAHPYTASAILLDQNTSDYQEHISLWIGLSHMPEGHFGTSCFTVHISYTFWSVRAWLVRNQTPSLMALLFEPPEPLWYAEREHCKEAVCQLADLPVQSQQRFLKRPEITS